MLPVLLPQAVCVPGTRGQRRNDSEDYNLQPKATRVLRMGRGFIALAVEVVVLRPRGEGDVSVVVESESVEATLSDRGERGTPLPRENGLRRAE